jgi:hypothetical protein
VYSTTYALASAVFGDPAASTVPEILPVGSALAELTPPAIVNIAARSAITAVRTPARFPRVERDEGMKGDMDQPDFEGKRRTTRTTERTDDVRD